MTDQPQKPLDLSQHDQLVALANRGIGYLNSHGGPSGQILKEVALVYDEVLRSGDQLLSETARLREQVATLKAALELAEGWFRHYAKQHTAKGTVDGDDKASRNMARAEYLRNTLKALEQSDG